jgi:hypothetical protein
MRDESAHLSPGNQSRLTSAATVIVSPEEVREKFRPVKPLKEISVTQRGWTLDVLSAVAAAYGGKACQRFGLRWQAQRDTAFAPESAIFPKRRHSRRTPK